MPMVHPSITAAAGAATDGGRRPTVVAAPAAAAPELSARPRRRTFTAKDKLRILADADRAAETGGIGAILRREGIYSSALTDWRRQRDAGAFSALNSSQARPEDRCSEPADCRSGPAPEGQCRSDAAAGACRGHHRTPKKSCGVAGHPAGAERRRALTDAVVALAPTGRVTAAACAALGVSRATVQRRRARLTAAPAIFRPRPRPARALTAPQRQVVLDLLHAPRFVDQAPAEIYASLLDEGVYHCSIRTMYRLLGSVAKLAMVSGVGMIGL